MKQTIRDLLTSKKFLAALISMVVWGVGLAGLNLSPEQVGAIVSPLYLYILGQAYADGGKEAAKINAGKPGKIMELMVSSEDGE